MKQLMGDQGLHSVLVGLHSELLMMLRSPANRNLYRNPSMIYASSTSMYYILDLDFRELEALMKTLVAHNGQ
jgi:hypothetical protein